MNKFGIHIKVKDIQKSYAFYKAFNLRPLFAYGNTKWQEQIKKDFPNTPTVDEKYEGVTLDINGALLEIANGHVAVKQEVFNQNIASSKVSAMIDINSIEEVVNTCEKNNFQIVVDPIDYPWGTREIVVKDPDGFILVFRQTI